MWFGDHTFSQVEVDRLKTLSEGLRTLDDKARKKKYKLVTFVDKLPKNNPSVRQLMSERFRTCA